MEIDSRGNGDYLLCYSDLSVYDCCSEFLVCQCDCCSEFLTGECEYCNEFSLYDYVLGVVTFIFVNVSTVEEDLQQQTKLVN